MSWVITYSQMSFVLFPTDWAFHTLKLRCSFWDADFVLLSTVEVSVCGLVLHFPPPPLQPR